MYWWGSGSGFMLFGESYKLHCAMEQRHYYEFRPYYVLTLCVQDASLGLYSYYKCGFFLALHKTERLLLGTVHKIKQLDCGPKCTMWIPPKVSDPMQWSYP